MKKAPAPPSSARAVRVLLASVNGAGTDAIKAWLTEDASLRIDGPARTIAEALGSAVASPPDAVLLDFHAQPVPVAYTVALFKQLQPAPAVFVLTHDASPPMRRCCAAAGVDRVFDKTTDLEALGAALRELVPG